MQLPAPAEREALVCEQCTAQPGSLTRRRFLALGGLGAAAGLLIPKAAAAQDGPRVDGVPIGGDHVIQPRGVWGADLPPTGALVEEAPEDVRFLLVHHSATTNDYSADQTIRYIQSFYRYHTSAEKGWPDVAYNFLVDRYGQIFEGRQGSIRSPVRGAATGGSQGYALLCSFIGDHREAAPTVEAQSAMAALLSWLAGRYSIDPGPGATVQFVSRGSNLHPEGKLVETPTITGHRTMSRTTCPGDRAFDLVQNSFPQRASDLLGGMGSSSASSEPRPVDAEAAPSDAAHSPGGAASSSTAIAAASTAPVTRGTTQGNGEEGSPSSSLSSSSSSPVAAGTAAPTATGRNLDAPRSDLSSPPLPAAAEPGALPVEGGGSTSAEPPSEAGAGRGRRRLLSLSAGMSAVLSAVILRLRRQAAAGNQAGGAAALPEETD